MAAKRNEHNERYNVAPGENVIISLMGRFSFTVGDRRVEAEILRSKKGFQLLAYLIIGRGEVAALKTLYNVLWPADESASPENALKTQISRMRALLDRFSPGMGECITNARGGYCWKNADNIHIDLYEINDLLKDMLASDADEVKISLGKRLSILYKGDLLNGCDCGWAHDEAKRLRGEYMSAMRGLIEAYKNQGSYDEIIKVCRAGLDVDAFNDTFHSELMNALAQSDRTTEALDQYKYASDLRLRFRGEQPSPVLQRSYKRLTHESGSLDISIMRIMRDLGEHSASSGAFLCEYSVFREVYTLQMRNLERLGKGIFLCVIMISDIDGRAMQPLMQSDVIRGTIGILRHNLRRGDTITQISPTLLAMLLPTVDYTTGNSVLERIKSAFYLKYPNSGIVFTSRLSPLEEKDVNSEGILDAKPVI